MNEVEKLYELAGVNKKCIDKRYEKCTGICYDCKYFIYSPFTAEKQIELIKWSARREPKVEIGYSSECGYWVENPTDIRYYFGNQFNNALASLINILWQDLTEEEKQQVKEILE